MSGHELPVLAPLVDGFARRVSYLRLSLTDRCNYRCTYCMPEAGVPLLPRPEVLSIEEIVRLVALLREVGVRRVRITGGEPTVRHGLVDLVGRLAALGLDDLALSTNAHTLAELAAPFRGAGLRRLNVSLDSLDPARFRQITRWGDVARVKAGLEAAREAGFTGTKVNAVALAGWNDHELVAIARWCWERELTPRFIEWMPMSDGVLYAPGSFMAAAAIRARLARELGPFVGDDGGDLPGVGPARYLRFAGGRVGVISPVSEPFCDTCNRIRLAADGQLHACLADDGTLDLKPLLRRGDSDEALVAALRRGLRAKVLGHDFKATGCGGPRKHMVAIGG